MAHFKEYMRNLYAFNRLYPQEKVWLHCDNTAYFQGDTIWFAAYVTSAETLQPAENLSKVLYVELLNETGEVISTQRLQVKDGRCHGQIPLNMELEKKFVGDKEQFGFYPIDRRTGNFCIPLPSGYYEVRAYTRAMLNWGTDICFSRVFPVFDTPEKEGDYSQLTMKHQEKMTDRIRPKTKREDRLNVDFYPEGGYIVCGLPCRVAYKVIGREGENLAAQCQLLVDGKPSVESKTVHDGMGSFRFLPQAGVKYKLRVKTEASERTFDLPEIQPQGIMLSMENTAGDSVRIAIAATDSLQNRPLGISITSRGKLLYFNVYDRLPLRPTRLPALPQTMFSAGVNQVTLFDADGRIHAERLFFVHDTTVTGKPLVDCRLDKEEYAPFSPITLTLQSRVGNQPISLSVRDKGAEIETHYRDNLQSYLLLSSDLKGYIHRPDYYFEAEDSAHNAALDLLMLTQGWRRYEWKQLAGVEKLETPHFVEEGLVLYGQVKHPTRKKKFLSNINVEAIVSEGKIVEQSGVTHTDKNGKFSFVVKTFTGRKRLSLNLTNENGNLVDGRILLHRHFSPQPREYCFMEKNVQQSIVKSPILQNTFSFEGENLLPIVQISKNRKSFEPFTLYNIKEERERALDIDNRQFLIYDLNSYVDDRYVASYPKIWSLEWNSSPEEGQEFFTPNDIGIGRNVTDLNIRYVDYILIYENATSYKNMKWIGNGPRLNDKRKHIHCWAYKKSKEIKGLRTTHINGYSYVANYYHPRYNREIVLGEIDFRRTLYWNPNIVLNEEGKATITFYNNGVCRKPTISVETLK